MAADPMVFEAEEGAGMRGGVNLPALSGNQNDFAGLGAFGSFGEFKLDRLPFFQGAMAFHHNDRMMHKNILPAIVLNESIAFGVAEPFDHTTLHTNLLKKPTRRIPEAPDALAPFASLYDHASSFPPLLHIRVAPVCEGKMGE
jgi:hypothetical protein